MSPPLACELGEAQDLGDRCALGNGKVHQGPHLTGSLSGDGGGREPHTVQGPPTSRAAVHT